MSFAGFRLLFTIIIDSNPEKAEISTGDQDATVLRLMHYTVYLFQLLFKQTLCNHFITQYSYQRLCFLTMTVQWNYINCLSRSHKLFFFVSLVPAFQNSDLKMRKIRNVAPTTTSGALIVKYQGGKCRGICAQVNLAQGQDCTNKKKILLVFFQAKEYKNALFNFLVRKIHETLLLIKFLRHSF